MAFEPIHCPTCHGVAVVKYGKTSDGKQRFRCQNSTCQGATFIHQLYLSGALTEVKRAIVDMSSMVVGFGNIARVLRVSRVR